MVSAPVVVAAGVHDVRLGLRGPVRLARVAFADSGQQPPGQAVEALHSIE
ncbi:hypothetical protein ACFY7C_16355 [Streptomyces sp. NPDC012769]